MSSQSTNGNHSHGATSINTISAHKSTNTVLVTLSSLIILFLSVASRFILIPYILHLLVLVTCILYTACHLSLQLLQDQALARGEVDPTDSQADHDAAAASATDTTNPDLKPTTETLKKEDAMKMPIMGSIALFSLYIAFKYFDKETVNKIISIYFGFVGCVALTATASTILSSSYVQKYTVGQVLTKLSFHKEIKWYFPCTVNRILPSWLRSSEASDNTPWDLSIDCNVGDVLSFLASALFIAMYIIHKKWWMNNVIGICFCIMGIQQFSLGTYKIGAIMLIGLFFYDIFWVFGTPVMVSVAKNLDGPIKILFPRSLIPDPVTHKIELSLLGLGDIIVPGFFLALLLRFDAYKAKVPYFPQINIHVSFPKPYFHSALIGYILGMGLTMFIMIYFKAAQPALLYLVPAVLGCSFVTALIRGEVKELLDYSEEVEEEKEEKAKEEESSASNKKDQ